MSQTGMNEVGLVVTQMGVDETEHPADESLPTVNELAWMQYALDNFGTVEEMVIGAPSVRIAPFFMMLHYLACDATGDCAVFEYIGGELVITTGEELAVSTLANDLYAPSVEYLGQFEGFGGDQPIPTTTSSLDRFVRASALAREETTGELPDVVYTVLEAVAQGDSTMWSIVYRPREGRVYFRTHSSSEIKSVDLSAFDLDCTSEVMILDMNSELAGDVTGNFTPYTTEANQTLLETTMAEMVDPEMIPQIALYPEMLPCTLDPGDGDADVDADADGDSDADADADDVIGEDGVDDGCSCKAASHLDRTKASTLIWCVLIGVSVLVIRRQRRS